MGKTGKGTGSFGLRNRNKSHTLCASMSQAIRPFPGAAGLRRAAIPPAVIDEQKTKSYGVLRVSFPLTDRSPPFLTLHRPSLRSPLLPHPEGHLQRVRLPLRSQA